MLRRVWKSTSFLGTVSHHLTAYIILHLPSDPSAGSLASSTNSWCWFMSSYPFYCITFFCAWSFFILGARTYHSAFRFVEVWTCILAMQPFIWTRTLAQAICLTHFERNSNISHSLKLKQGITLRLLNNILVHRSCRCKTASLTSPGLFVWAGSGDSIEGFGAIPLRRDGLYSQHEHAEQSTWVRATDWVFTAIIFQG